MKPSRMQRAMRYVALAVVGMTIGFLLSRFVFPVVLERGALFLVLPILLVATLLFVRASRRGRSGS